MSDGMGREFTYLSSHATNRYFIPNWGQDCHLLNDLNILRILRCWLLGMQKLAVPRRNEASANPK